MALPASVQLDYQMTGSAKGLTYHANGELAWQNTGSAYNASMTVKALFIGSRTLSSTGQVSGQGLAPSRFTDKSRTEVAAHFEPDKGQISFSANTPTLPWTPGAQDRVSVFMQLGGMLAGNPAAFPVGSQITLRTVGPRDADMWTFLVENEAPLSLPFGELATLKLSRKPRHEYDQKLEVWYAPALVHWYGVSPAKSLFFSVVAVLRNARAFLVYGLLWTALSLGVGLAMMLVLLMTTTHSDIGLATMAMFPLSIILAAMFFTSLWFTFLGSFQPDDEPLIDTPTT